MTAENLQLYSIVAIFLLIFIGTAIAGYRTRDRRLLYLLPLAHLLICGVVQLADWAWLPVLIIEFPVSIALLVAGWHFNLPPLLLCGTIGTLWWYFLGRLLFAFLCKPE